MCAFNRDGIEHDIANGDVVPVRMQDGSTFDEVRFSGHSTIADLMRQALGLCDRFGWVPPALPHGTADLSDSLKTLNCVRAIEQWTVEKIGALEANSEKQSGETGSDSSRGPWHSAGESVPEEFANGPLTGTKDELADWILPESDARTPRHRQIREFLTKNSASFWARSAGRTRHEVYFRDPKRYAQANANRLRSE